MEKVDEDLVKEALQEELKGKSLRARRREQAKQRTKLGFKEPEELAEDDEVLNRLEREAYQHEKKLSDQRERKPVDLITEVKGISK